MAKGKAKNPVDEMLGMAGDFVVKQKGKWEHKDWEAFLDKVQKAGVNLSDELKKSLGHILEATKRFYSEVSSVPNKKAPAKKKSKPRAKAKPKSKSKSKG